jgi:hypothetical protein
MSIVKTITDSRIPALVSKARGTFEEYQRLRKRYDTFNGLPSFNSASKADVNSAETYLREFCAAIPAKQKEAEGSVEASAYLYAGLVESLPICEQAVAMITQEITRLEKERTEAEAAERYRYWQEEKQRKQEEAEAAERRRQEEERQEEADEKRRKEAAKRIRKSIAVLISIIIGISGWVCVPLMRSIYNGSIQLINLIISIRIFSLIISAVILGITFKSTATIFKGGIVGIAVICIGYSLGTGAAGGAFAVVFFFIGGRIGWGCADSVIGRVISVIIGCVIGFLAGGLIGHFIGQHIGPIPLPKGTGSVISTGSIGFWIGAGIDVLIRKHRSSRD